MGVEESTTPMLKADKEEQHAGQAEADFIRSSSF
jgi:hypothetical protein